MLFSLHVLFDLGRMRRWLGIFVGGVTCICVLRAVLRRPGLLLVVRGPKCEADFYCELAKAELGVVASVEAVEQLDAVEFQLCSVVKNEIVARLPIPDTRVYRTLPSALVRSVIACGRRPPAGSLSSMRQLVHDASFSSLMRAPLNVSSSFSDCDQIPGGVYWLNSPRVVAECFLYDVAHAKHDPLPTRSLVVDEVCSKGFEHHGCDWDSFLDSIYNHFAVETSSITSLEELRKVLLESKNTFSSAVLTPAGANKLELVFGVPATQFPFLNCAVESYVFVHQLYTASIEAFGRWTYENFVAFIHAVFGHDRPEVVRHVPRIFRTLNRSRNGEISFDELCGWIARKLSTRTARHPEQQLVATVMSLRLPYVLFADKRHLWPKLECVLRSLSDDEYHL